jgi:hypothetical protein
VSHTSGAPTDNSTTGITYTSLRVGIFSGIDVPFNVSDFVFLCGSPSLYSFLEFPLTGADKPANVYATPYRINDQVGVLNQRTSKTQNDLCSEGLINSHRYTYYTARYDEISSTGTLAESSCDVANATTYTGPCVIALQLYLSTVLVQTQTSAHGIDTLQILIDEGSIVGGVLFFTWFFSIFVV